MEELERASRGRAMRGFAVAAAIALLLHLLFVMLLPAAFRTVESSDFRWHYAPTARSLLEGDGLREAEGRPAVRYPPGFPLLIALSWSLGEKVGLEREAALRLAIALWTALGAGFFHLLARSLTVPRTAWLATLLWLTYPPFLWLGKQPNSETPFFIFFFAGLWCAVTAFRRWRENSRVAAWALSAGVCLGSASLIRPAVLLIFLPLSLAVFWAGRREDGGRSRLGLLLLLACIGLGQLAIMAPWELWLHGQTGRWHPLSTGGRLSILDGLTISTEAGGQGLWISRGAEELMQDVEEHRGEIHGLTSAASFLLGRALERPPPVLELFAVKALRSWYATDSLRFEGPLAFLQLAYLSLAARGLLRARRASNSLFLPLVVCVTLYFWSMTIVVLSILRYMMPAMALLMLPAAISLEPHSRRVREKAGLDDE